MPSALDKQLTIKQSNTYSIIYSSINIVQLIMKLLLTSLSLLSSTCALHIDLNVLIVNGNTSQDVRSVTEQGETNLIQENDVDTNEKTCPGILYSASSGLSPSFPGVIAHGIHSLSAPDVRRFFPSSAKMPFSIPVVNPDLSSSEPILFSPPDFDHTFNRFVTNAQ
jgi:hypothetical protein